MNAPKRRRAIRKQIALLLAVCFAMVFGPGAIGAYFSSRTLTLQLRPDLSSVPTPTPSPTPTVTPTPTPTVSPTPTPTAAPGTGLVFANQCTFVRADWNTAYNGNFTSITMTVDNVKHTMNFNLVFTVPDGHTQQELTNNRYWFGGFYIRVSGKNTYDGSISLAGNQSNNNGYGTAQLQNVSLAAGAGSDDILVYFYGYNWSIPSYNPNGNTVVLESNKSYTNVGININRAPWYYTEKYTQTATVTLILPSQVATPTPSPTSTPSPTPTPTSTPSPTPTPTATPSPTPSLTPTPSPTPTYTPTAAPTAAPTVTPAPTDTATPEPTVTDTATADPTAGVESLAAPMMLMAADTSEAAAPPEATATPTPAPTAPPTDAPTTGTENPP